MRTLFLAVVAAGIVAWTGFPVPFGVNTARKALAPANLAAPVSAGNPVTVVEPVERWRESGSLVLLASALFGASVVMNRRRRTSPRDRGCIEERRADGSGPADMTSATGTPVI
jgi:hypothetical protein